MGLFALCGSFATVAWTCSDRRKGRTVVGPPVEPGVYLCELGR
jgi:hypothetical protein